MDLLTDALTSEIELRPNTKCQWVNRVVESILSDIHDVIIIEGVVNPRELAKVIEKSPLEVFKKLPNIICHSYYDKEYFYPDSIHPLSVGIILNGQHTITTSDNQFVFNDTGYFILNNRRYSVQSEKDSEELRIFFNPLLVEEVLSSLILPVDQFLDDTEAGYKQPVWFFEKIYPSDQQVMPLLIKIRKALSLGIATPGWYEEFFYFLLERVFQTHRDVYKEITQLPVVRRSTKIEIYHRLHQARNFMEGHLFQSIGLGQIAKAAHLSKSYFLFLFKQLFSETPHRYLTRRRLEEGWKQVLTTDHPITEIGSNVGFSNLQSFTPLFQQRFGITPQQLRRLKRKLDLSKPPFSPSHFPLSY